MSPSAAIAIAAVKRLITRRGEATHDLPWTDIPGSPAGAAALLRFSALRAAHYLA